MRVSTKAIFLNGVVVAGMAWSSGFVGNARSVKARQKENLPIPTRWGIGEWCAVNWLACATAFCY
jgi:hypothetical protein